MGFYYKDSELIGQRGPIGPAGPDGNAIGTIISFMGTAAPDGYLVCDGASYAIADYSDLANFFQTQFGSTNYFGGDGTSTFAVPDLRNLFLRGYHGESSEQLSGEIGEKQEGTQHLYMFSSSTSHISSLSLAKINRLENLYPQNIDVNVSSIGSGDSATRTFISDLATGPIPTEAEKTELYTSRPVNTAVLYCIKYLKPKTSLVEGGMSESEADAKFLALSGGTMTGTLDMGGQQIHAIDNLSFNPNNISGTAIDPSSTNSWIYLEGKNKRFSFVSSGTRARLLIGEPTENRDATTKKYVDDKDSGLLPLSGGTLTGMLRSSINNVFRGNGFNTTSLTLPIIADITSYGVEADNSGTGKSYNLYPNIEFHAPGSIYTTSLESRNTILRGIATPTNSNDATNKSYVDYNFLSTAKTQESVNLGYGPSESGISAQASDASAAEEDTEVAATWDVIKINGHASFAQDATMGGNKLRNLGYPTHSNDAATKEYVDDSRSAGPSGDQNIYSTDETVVGTWIDGRSIYRRVISITSGTAAKSVPAGRSNLSNGFITEVSHLISLKAFSDISKSSGYNSEKDVIHSGISYSGKCTLELSATKTTSGYLVFNVGIYNPLTVSLYAYDAYLVLEYTKEDVLS